MDTRRLRIVRPWLAGVPVTVLPTSEVIVDEVTAENLIAGHMAEEGEQKTGRVLNVAAFINKPRGPSERY